jgi:thiol:disulfide interchange protein
VKFAVLVLGCLFASIPAIASEGPFNKNSHPEQDLADAKKESRLEGKNIIVDVGGNWCEWCIAIDRTLQQDASLKQLLDKNFVVIHVDYGEFRARNREFLKQFPPFKGVPNWFVLNADGKLLIDQNPAFIKGKKSHDLDSDAIRDFLEKWAPKSQN